MRTSSAMIAGLVLLTLVGCSPTGSTPETSPSFADSQDGPDPVFAAMKQCLEAKGWEVEEDQGALVGPVLPHDQGALYEADQEECGKTTGFFEPPVVTEESAAVDYEKQLVLSECVEAAGLPVDPPPSEEAFVEALARGEILWTAYGAVMRGGDGDQLDEMMKVCPDQ